MIERRYVERVLTVEEADALIGVDVEDLDADVDDEVVIVDRATGLEVLAYLRFPGDVAAYRRTVLAVPISTTLRGSGLRNASRTFGMAARNTVLRRESCRPAGLALDAPDVHAELVAVAALLDRQWAEVAPERRVEDLGLVEGVHPDWRLAPGTVWTSGNINLLSSLPYHRDRANYAAWSAMPVLRRGVRGGFLHVPEYGVTLACRDGWVCYFDGNRLVHGVTPIRQVDPDGYRYSIVHYALAGMKHCLEVAEEQARAQRKRTEREARALDDSPALAARISPGIRGTTREDPA